MSKKILIVGTDENFSLEKMYFRSMKSLNFNTKILNIYNLHKNFLEKVLWKFFKFFFFYIYRKKLIKFFKKENNFDLIIIFKGIYLDPETLIECKKICKKAKFINIYPDDPLDFSKDISSANVLRSIKYYDFFFIWSDDIKTKIKKKLKLNNLHILPFAYDKFLHKYSRIVKKPYYDVAFIGTADKERIKIIKALKNYNVIVAGMGWKNIYLPKSIKKINSAVDAIKMSEIYKNSKICLNIFRKQNYNSHNMKSFEIILMGGLMLTRNSLDQRKFFKGYKACVYYKNNNNIKKKINDILGDYKKYKFSEKIIKKLQREHSYVNRSVEILKKTNLL